MSTPSERIFVQREDGDGTELRDVLPPRARHVLRTVSERTTRTSFCSRRNSN